jgi:thiamine kinase-like enzyme
MVFPHLLTRRARRPKKMSASKPPPAEGVRVHWKQLPLAVKQAIEVRIGDTVVEAVTQPGGFSPGLAARVRTNDGRRCFVKAVSELANPDTPDLHRREAEVVAALPRDAPVPRLLWSYDAGGWVALGFEDVEGSTPAQPWRDDELRLVVDGLNRLHTVLTPSPIASTTAADGFAMHVKGWSELKELQAEGLDPWLKRNLDRLVELEARAPAAASGRTLLNFDVRADNMIVGGGKVYFVDWPWARIGAPFVEWVAFAPSVYMQGGPKPEELLRIGSVGGVDDGRINAVIASLTGYFLAYSRRPPPPGIPTVRAFQAAQGQISLEWLRERTGWR